MYQFSIKKYLPIILFFSTSFCYGQNSSINGVVTYYFNQYQGNKPDIGAKVYVFSSANNFFSAEVLDSFQNCKFQKHICDGLLSNASSYDELAKQYKKGMFFKKMIKEYQARADSFRTEYAKCDIDLKAMGIKSPIDYEALDKRAAGEVLDVNENNSSFTFVDGVGNFSMKVKPGTYCVLIISKNRKSMSHTEVLGQVFYKKVTVEEDQTKSITNNFEVY